MELTATLGFAAVALMLIAIPGPDWAYVLAAGTRDRVVVPAIAGLATGYILLTIVVSLGIGALVANDPAGMTALTLAGGVYLTYLGVHTLRARAAVSVEDTPVVASSRGRYVTRGVGVSALNPKGMLLFVAILPQFASRHAGWPLPAQLAGLGAVYVVIAIAFYLTLGFLARSILGSRPAVSSMTTTIAGVAMVVAGVALVAERLIA